MKTPTIPVKAVALAATRPPHEGRARVANRFSTSFIRCAFAVAAALAGTGALAQTLYTATPIRDPDRNLLTSAIRINASGVVLAQTWSRDDDAFTPFAYHASFTYDAGANTDLGAVMAFGINDRGQIAGGYPMKGDGRIHAFLMTGRSMLDVNPSVAYSSRALAVNASGDVAGWYMRDSTESLGSMRGFAIVGGAVVDIGAPPGAPSSALSYSYSYASALNASGDVAGVFGDQSSHHAFRWSRGQLQDLGTLGGSFSEATDINASGDVVGRSALADDSVWRAFVYTNGTMRDLGTPAGSDSFAYGINAAGHVVGSYTEQNQPHAFIYADGQVRDLNALVVNGLDGAIIHSANAINDAGQIVADACSGDDCFGLRLDPIPVASGTAIEYYHAEFDHYFVTANAGEIAKLDSGAISGWARTGQTFGVAPGLTAGASPVCRFFSTSFAPKSSHFYTASDEECALVKRNLSRDWQFEGIVFFVAIPDAAGTCPSGTKPLYRIYNGGRGGAPNHRYTTSLALRGQMVAAGWIPEGQGPLGVAMCATP